MDVPQLDRIDLTLPVATGAMAILLGASTARILTDSSWQTRLLFLVTIVGGIALFWFFGGSQVEASPNGNWWRIADNDPFTTAEYAIYYGPLLAVGFGLLAVTGVLAKLTQKNLARSPWITKILSALNKQRSRMMIGFVAVMLPATVLRNLFDPHHQSTIYLVGLFLVLVIPLAILIFTHFLIQIYSADRWRITKSVALIIASLVGGMILGAGTWNGRGASVGQAWAIAFSPAMFSLALIAMLTFKTPHDREADQRYFSFWSLALAAIWFLTFAGVTIRYDLQVCAIAFIENDDFFSNRTWLDLAKESQDIKRATNGAAKIDYWSNNINRLHVRIRDQGDEGVFRKLSLVKPNLTRFLSIENLQPFVDTKPLVGYCPWLEITGGECSSSQFRDITSNGQQVSFDGVRLPDRNDHGATNATIHVGGSESNGSLPAFLDAYAATGLGQVFVSGVYTQEDLQAIIRHNQECPFTIYAYDSDAALHVETFQSSTQQSLNGITIYGLGRASEKQWVRLLVESDLNSVDFPFTDLQSFWDYAFLKPNTLLNGTSDSFTRTFKQLARDFHWAYQWNDQGDITHTWLPGMDAVRQYAGDLNQIHTLRLDFDGICGCDVGTNYDDMMGLSKLINLRRLYLSREMEVDNLSFLRSLTKLEHLQIKSNDSSLRMTPIGLNVCQSLQSMRMFGSPDSQTVKDLAKLPKLSRLEIVDLDDAFADQATIDQLKQQLPNTKVTIVTGEDYQPDLSDELKEHLKRVRKQARARLLSDTQDTPQ